MPPFFLPKCLLSIDGMLLVDDRCNFRVSPDGHRTTLDAGKDYAEVNVTPRGAAIGFWNRGIGHRDRLTSLGLVTRFDSSGAYCYHNRGFEMCDTVLDLRARYLDLQFLLNKIKSAFGVSN